MCFSSKQESIQLGSLSLDGLLILGANGLREKHRKPFEKYDRSMREANSDHSKAEVEDKKFINKRIEEDTKKVRQEVQDIIRRLHDSIYPWAHISSIEGLLVITKFLVWQVRSTFDRI